jgi:ABC-type transport system involved in Fe-S cluster assembly fused permease/ATPase subunit
VERGDFFGFGADNVYATGQRFCSDRSAAGIDHQSITVNDIVMNRAINNHR